MLEADPNRVHVARARVRRRENQNLRMHCIRELEEERLMQSEEEHEYDDFLDDYDPFDDPLERDDPPDDPYEQDDYNDPLDDYYDDPCDDHDDFYFYDPVDLDY